VQSVEAKALKHWEGFVRADFHPDEKLEIRNLWSIKLAIVVDLKLLLPIYHPVPTTVCSRVLQQTYMGTISCMVMFTESYSPLYSKNAQAAQLVPC
jgi:hypothetical protein